jgi:hypothetical protein
VVAVVLAALIFWICIFLIYFAAQGVSPLEFFAGHYEPHDPELGRWKETGRDEDSGLVREQRLLLPDGRESAAHLLLQVRYRDPETRQISAVEPAQRVPRRRVGRNKAP